MTSWLFYLFLFAMPLGTRLLLFTFIPGFHEYEAAFVYASDIVLLLFLAAAAIRYPFRARGEKSQITKDTLHTNSKSKFQNPKWPGIFLALFVGFAFASILWASSPGLAFYQFARLLLLIGLALGAAALVRQGTVRIQTILAVIAAVAIAQSLLAVAQFAAQSDLGLQILGEPSFGWRVIYDNKGLVLRPVRQSLGVVGSFSE